MIRGVRPYIRITFLSNLKHHRNMRTSKEFEINEKGVTAEGFKTLNRKCLSSMYLWNVIAMAVLLLSVFLIYRFINMPWIDMDLLFTITVAALVLLAAYFVIGPMVFFARYRYRMTDDRIDILRGIFIIRHTVIPIERVHQVEVSRGPINNMFGLANVNITTAGGMAIIEYLEFPVAEEISDRLNDIVVNILKERE